MRAHRDKNRQSLALHAKHALTPAESRVALALARGAKPADIAAAHGVTVSTVRSQLKAIFRKTGTCSQAQLVAWVFRQSG
ncbi:MAG TPA: helix-turn-helix transcriptional regulator [Rhizomicrobium sp.]|nr:helix-turn-helix transcriptional regulator [Rhizomicrobium sp.]